jgi:hypothetical protein
VKKYLPSLVCGFGAGVLQVVPFVKSFSCCMIMPLAAFLALILEQRSTNNFSLITAKKALVVGFMTGLFAAVFGTVFDLFITFITKQNDIMAAFPELQRMIDSFPLTEDVKHEVLSLFQSIRNDILNSGFSWFYTMSVLVNDFIINTVFGIIGGLVGSKVINSRSNDSQNNF